jgi:hypothetical protein
MSVPSAGKADVIRRDDGMAGRDGDVGWGIGKRAEMLWKSELPVLRSGRGMPFRLGVDTNGPVLRTRVPLRLSCAQFDPAVGETARKIGARMRRQSAALGTMLIRCPDGLSLALR